MTTSSNFSLLFKSMIFASSIHNSTTIVNTYLEIAVLEILTNFVLYRYLIRSIKITSQTRGAELLPYTPS